MMLGGCHEKDSDMYYWGSIMNIFTKTMRIAIEFIRAAVLLKGVGPTVTIFGSARTPQRSKYYNKAYHLGRRLADSGFNVITGGGNCGIMEAANKGAFESQNATSIGLSIKLDSEKKHNDFLNKHLMFDFFFTRKYMMTSTSFAYIVFPGGVGTLDEFFEVVTLMQTGKAKPGKILLVGSEFYNPLVTYMKTTMLNEGVISLEDFDLFEVVDDVSEIVDKVLKAHKES